MNERLQIAENIKRIKSELGSVKLLAATKTVDADTINFAIDNGVLLIGENRVQELLDKYGKIHRDKVELHFIGALQTNKVKYIIDKVDMIQSVDREALALEIEKQAARINKIMPVLVEINIGSEPSKSGILPENAAEFCEFVSKLPHLLLKGLMAVPPKCAVGEENTEYFLKMRKIFIDIKSKNVDNSSMDILSVGMSGDYKAAVQNGSSMVRLGTAVFGERTYNK